MLAQILRMLAQLGAVPIVIGLVEGGSVERQFVVLVLQLVGPLLQTLMFAALGVCVHAGILRS